MRAFNCASISKHPARDVLQVDAAEGWLQRRHGFDHALDGVGGDLDVEHVDPGEFLEQHRLAFHDGLGSKRTDVPRPSTAVPLETTPTRLARAV
jgi:hypothetical protein